MEELGITLGEHTREQVQLHSSARNISQRYAKLHHQRLVKLSNTESLFWYLENKSHIHNTGNPQGTG